MHHPQLQTAKPSGLRMPSPSLGFFGQPKASSLRSPLQRSFQPHKFESNIPNFRKPDAINHIHDLRPPTHPGKIPNVVNNVRTIGGNMEEVLCSSLECSDPSTVNPASHNRQDEKMKSVLKMNNRQKVEVKVPRQALKYQQQLHSIIDDVEQQVLERAEPYKTEMISHTMDMELQKIDDKFPLQEGAPCGQLGKSDDSKISDVCLRNRDLSETELENHPSISCLSPAVQDKGISGTNDLIDHQTLEHQPYNLKIKNGGDLSGLNSGAACYNTWSTSEEKVPCQAVKNQQQLHNIIDNVDQPVLKCAEPYKTEMISHSEDIELQKIDDKFPLQGAPCGQLDKSDDNKKVADVCLRNRDSSGTELENHPSISCLSPAVQDIGVSGTNGLIDHQAVEDQAYNLAITNGGAFSGSNSGAASYNTWSTLKANDDWSSGSHKVKEQSGEQAELKKPFTRKDDKMSSESQRLWANDASLLEDSGAPEESQKFSCMADVSPKVQDCIETEEERSHGQSLYMHMEQAKDDGSKDDKTSRKSPVGDVHAESLDGDMSDATSRSRLSTSTGDNQVIVVVDEVNKRFGEELELHQSIESVKLEASGACESNSKSSGGLCLIPAAMQTCGHDMAKTVECQYADDAPSISVDCEPVVENYNSSIDTQFRHDMELHGQVCSMELDMMVENHMPGNDCPKSGDYSASELENPQTSPVLHIESGSGIDDVIQREDMEEKKCTLSTKNPHSISEFQTGDDSGSSYLDTSIMHIDLLSSKHSTNEHSVERAKLILPCPCEADTMSYEENKSPETYHSLLFAKSQSFGGSMKLNSRTMADNSKVKGSGGSGLESPHGLSQHKHVDQATKEVESHVVQSPDFSILFDSCNSGASILEVNNQCEMVVDDVNDQSGHPELPNSILVVERVFQQDDLLLANTTSGELNKENDFGVSEQSDVYGSESKSVELFSHVTPASQDNGLDADQEVECLHMDDEVTGSVNLEPLVENPEHYSDEKFWHDNGLSGQASSLEAARLSTDQISAAVAICNSKPFCSLNEESGLSAISVHASEREAETSISQSCEMQQDLDQATYATEDKDATVQPRKPEDYEKEEALVVKPPPHAVPFSDEWLAAFEAAGEEILTMKSGAVQNSPPDKCPHEPGPWSPVKKKNNQGIGPFDCTKHTNIPSSSSQ
ncbi:uncharacterized protein LOC132163471 [Corylus avellana]|uniref:uncharacterized protein LOC132163471 n=1 Tax=Corylus avellana TaxID=13451 RepID=UPI00286BF816|nr:uncharacterized protein LOC132163471 [Corylus avellana]